MTDHLRYAPKPNSGGGGSDQSSEPKSYGGNESGKSSGPSNHLEHTAHVGSNPTLKLHAYSFQPTVRYLQQRYAMPQLSSMF